MWIYGMSICSMHLLTTTDPYPMAMHGIHPILGECRELWGKAPPTRRLDAIRTHKQKFCQLTP